MTKIYDMVRAFLLTAIITIAVVLCIVEREQIPAHVEADDPEEPAVTEEVKEPAMEEKEEPEEIFTPFYPLSDEDRDLVERVVTAESVGQPFEGQMAVAQCILNTAVARGETPGEVVTAPGQYASPADPGRVTASVEEAVAFVFDHGRVVTEEPIRYFYAPALCESAWHESLEHVMTIADHKFFKLPD